MRGTGAPAAQPPQWPAEPALSWPAEAPLKQYLGFSTEQDLDEEEWFVVAMPDELELRHTLALYQLMRSRAD